MFTSHVQKESPSVPKQAANWLPAPEGPFTVAIRVYGADASVLDGSWTMPTLSVAGGSDGAEKTVRG
ncbi:DUF1214 domain-containing protein [Streptomyces sp. Je 1-332]|uniref:DUF1214 domain-containing protein n=1 Tax=Streptomyces sp. Je 1-332 TaxID=3231270 RepID=UPI00345B1972